MLEKDRKNGLRGSFFFCCLMFFFLGDFVVAKRKSIKVLVVFHFLFLFCFGCSRRYAATDWSIPFNWIRFVSSILHAMQAILMQLCQGGIREHDIALKTLFLWDMDDLWIQVSARRDRCVNKPAITVGEI